MAALSVHSSGGGTRRWIPSSAHRFARASLRRLLAETPPAKTSSDTPVRWTAAIDFSVSTSTTASWKLAATSAGYRDAVQAIYYKADIPADSKSNMQAAVRYHIAQRLRVYMRAEGYTADDFEYYRLNPDDAAERNKRRARERTVRARQAVEMLSSATGNTAYRQQDITQLMGSTPDDAASPAPNPDELAALVTAASARFRELVSRAELDALVRLKHSEREKLREELDALETAAALVRSYL